MRRTNSYLFAFLLFCCVRGLSAQLIEPLEYTVRVEQRNDTLELTLEAPIHSGWYMYASDFDPDLGPTRATLTLEPHPSYKLIGVLQSINSQTKYDSIFEGNYTYFSKRAKLRQLFLTKSTQPIINGYLSYQICSNATGQCVSFDFFLDSVSVFGKIATSSGVSPSLPLASESDSSSFYTTPEPVEQTLLKTEEQSEESDSRDEKKEKETLWGFFFLAFIAGLAALMTPCVFPLIPMTVTYFTEANKGARSSAIFYGVCIILIYTLIGFVLAPFMGPELANELATGWIPNIIFFIIFLVFGFSFLGFFEIMLPYKWTNFTEGKADKKGPLSIFFMALTLVLITFSCTGPIVGSILVQSVGGLQLKPVIGMMGYSLAFALPFSLFALFPKWLSTLPRSGSWLNIVKVTLGFLELAFALKFLSIADQAYHWGILDREVYLSLWITIFGLLALYLLGKLRLPKEGALKEIGLLRMVVAISCISFIIYLIPGMFGAPLKALSGYLPPQSTHDFDLNKQSASLIAEEPPCGPPIYGHLLEFPHRLQGYFDYEQAIACARSENKPLFIDFTGHGCVNCREMEARVWADERVLRRLRSNYILVALYVDEKTALAREKWYTSSYDGKIKKTIGKKNADFQISRFQNNAQPYYVLLGRDEELLLPPRAYNLDVNAFIDYLDQGSKAYRSRYKK